MYPIPESALLQLLLIAMHGAMQAVALTLWAFGLKHCGPTRTILLDYSEVFVYYLIVSVSGKRRWPAALVHKRRAGLLTLLLAYGCRVHLSRGSRSLAGASVGIGTNAAGSGW